MEHLIHSNEKMLAHVNVLICHSRSTGEAAYLRTEFSIRGEFVNLKDKDIIEPVCDDVDPESFKDSEDLMKRMDQDDATTAKENAIELLRKVKERKNFRAKVNRITKDSVNSDKHSKLPTIIEENERQLNSLDDNYRLYYRYLFPQLVKEYEEE